MTYQEFKNKYNGKYVDYDGGYGSQCWDLAEYYFTECLKLPSSILAGCGLVSNMLKGEKRKLLDKYFDEVPTNAMQAGDVVIWEYGHIAIYDHWDGKYCYYFSQNPNPCKVMVITATGNHAFRLKTKEPQKINVIYQTHDKVLNKYWNEVVNYNLNNNEGYAGFIGHAIDGIKVRLSNGAKVYYQAHLLNGSWLPVVSKADNTDSGYAGIYGKTIDGISLKAEGITLSYRVHLLNGGWLDWVNKMDINDSINGMAGIYGKAIDAIQIRVI